MKEIKSNLITDLLNEKQELINKHYEQNNRRIKLAKMKRKYILKNKKLEKENKTIKKLKKDIINIKKVHQTLFIISEMLVSVLAGILSPTLLVGVVSSIGVGSILGLSMAKNYNRVVKPLKDKLKTLGIDDYKKTIVSNRKRINSISKNEKICIELEEMIKECDISLKSIVHDIVQVDRLIRMENLNNNKQNNDNKQKIINYNNEKKLLQDIGRVFFERKNGEVHLLHEDKIEKENAKKLVMGLNTKRN